MILERLAENKALGVFFFIIISTWKLLVKYAMTDVYLKIRNAPNLPKSAQIKFGIAFYKFQYYISAVCLGVTVLWTENWIFEPNSYKIPFETIPLKFRIYYNYEVCFYLNELLTMAFEPKKKDTVQLFFHHIATLLLMYLSFTVDLTKYGVLILLLHDISDPLLEFSKMENYLKNEITADVGFLVFMVVFLTSRLFIYPRYLAYTAINNLIRAGLRLDTATISALLVVLQIMHIIWSRYIVALLIRVIDGKAPKDTRE